MMPFIVENTGWQPESEEDKDLLPKLSGAASISMVPVARGVEFHRHRFLPIRDTRGRGVEPRPRWLTEEKMTWTCR